VIQRFKKPVSPHGHPPQGADQTSLCPTVASEISGQEIFYDLLRRGAVFDEGMRPEDWRLPDPGEPAEL
jgi:hypothetical protein